MFEKLFPTENFKPQSPAEASLLVWTQKLARSGHDKADLICCTFKDCSDEPIVLALAVFRIFVPTRDCVKQVCVEPVPGIEGLLDKCGHDFYDRFRRMRCLADPSGQEMEVCDSFEEFIVVGDPAPTKLRACDSLAPMFDVLLCQMSVYSKDAVVQPKEGRRVTVENHIDGNSLTPDRDWKLCNYLCLHLGENHPKGTFKLAFLARRFGLGNVGHPPPGSSGTEIINCKSKGKVGMYSGEDDTSCGYSDNLLGLSTSFGYIMGAKSSDIVD